MGVDGDAPEVVLRVSDRRVLQGFLAGVGIGFDPPQYVQEGDVFELGVDGLGSQRQVAVKEA